MTRWRRWTFAVQAPADEFQRVLQRGLLVRGVQVEPARHFDFVGRAYGARAYVKLAWIEGGIEAVVKLKAGLFGAPAAIERLLLEAAREAEARLAPPPPPENGKTS